MKKLIALFTSAAMLLSFAACTPKEPAESTSSSTESTAEGIYPVVKEDAIDTSKVQITNVPEDLFPADGTTFDAPFVAPMENAPSQVADLDNDGVIRVACMGDSITEGNPGSNWPEFLQEYLNYLGTIDGKTYEVKNFGKAGSAVHRVLENIDNSIGGWQVIEDTDGDGQAYFLYDDPRYIESLTYKADLVIVQHGANDGLGGNASELENYFISDYSNHLILPYVKNGAKVVISTPTYASNGWVDSYVNGWISEAVRQMAKTYGLQCVDLNKITQPRRESLPDGIHGNVSGYKLMAQTYANQIFGMDLSTVTFKAAENTEIEMGVHMTTVHSEGIATIQLVKGLEDSGSFDVSLTCKNHKPVKETVEINGSKTFEYTLERTYNLAVGKTVTASSTQHNDDGTVRPPELAVDDDLTTRWESEFKDNQWLVVDLGQVYEINGVNIYWEGAYASKYKLSVSEDGESYTEVATVEISKEGLESTVFEQVNARYVRFDCLKRGTTKFGCSIYEFQVLSDHEQ